MLNLQQTGFNESVGGQFESGNWSSVLTLPLQVAAIFSCSTSWKYKNNNSPSVSHVLFCFVYGDWWQFDGVVVVCVGGADAVKVICCREMNPSMLLTLVSGWCWRPAGFWSSFSFSWIGFDGTSTERASTWLTVVTNHLNPNQTPAGDGFKSVFLFYFFVYFESNTYRIPKSAECPFLFIPRRRGNQNVNTNWLFRCRNTTTFTASSDCFATPADLKWFVRVLAPHGRFCFLSFFFIYLFIFTIFYS